MSKIKLIFLLVAVCFLCACNKESKLHRVVLPDLFVDSYENGLDECYDFFDEFDENYVTDVVIENDELILYLTEEQEDNLMAYYEDFAQTYFDKFLEFDENYRYEVSSDYRNAKIYFDEKCPPFTLNFTLGYVPYNAMLHLILKEHNEDCIVHVELYNCHTDKLIVEYDIPGDAVTFGLEDIM